MPQNYAAHRTAWAMSKMMKKSIKQGKRALIKDGKYNRQHQKSPVWVQRHSDRAWIRNVRKYWKPIDKACLWVLYFGWTSASFNTSLSWATRTTTGLFVLRCLFLFFYFYFCSRINSFFLHTPSVSSLIFMVFNNLFDFFFWNLGIFGYFMNRRFI